MFDELLELEQSSYTRGFNAGHSIGKHQGYESGKSLGIDQSRSIVCELAVYRGVCKGIQALDTRTHFLTTRQSSMICTILAESSSCILGDLEHLMDRLEHVRAKYKTLLSVLGLSMYLSTTAKQDDLTF
jgi:flagellar biosynthesis/type III secretory pathway protein FliH